MTEQLFSYYNSKKAFTRILLNEFEFTRYDETSPMRDNDNFLKLFHWLVLSMRNDLFNHVEDFLMEEETFIKEKSNIFMKNVMLNL